MKAKIHPVVIAVAIPALIGLILIVGIVFSAEQKRAEDLMHAYTESIARGVSAFFIDAKVIGEAAANLHCVQDFELDAAIMDFMSLISAAQNVNRISIVDKEGYVHDVYRSGPAGNRWQGGRRTIDNNDPNAELVSLYGRPHFNELVTNNVRGDFYTITNEVYVPYGMHEWAFLTSVPIIKEGKAIGMVNVAQTAMELSHLYEDLSMDFLDKFGKAAHLFLVSRNGNLISNLEYNKTYGAYMDELFGASEIKPISVLSDDAVKAIREAVEDEKRIVDGELHGDKHFLAGVKIENTPFAVCLSVLQSRMLYATRHIALIGIVAFAVTALAVAIVFFAIGKSMPDRPEDDSKDDTKPRPDRQKRRNRPSRASGKIEDFAPPVLPPDV